MNIDKPVTKREFDNAISRIDENFADLKQDIVGLGERIQVQLDALQKTFPQSSTTTLSQK